MNLNEKRDKKIALYTFVGGIRDDGSVYSMSRGIYDYELDADGWVYPPKHRRIWRHPLERWYVCIEKHGYNTAWIVRRDKLTDIRAIEALRWRILRVLHEKAIPTFGEVRERSKKIGRIFHRKWSGTGQEQFTKWDEHGNQESYDIDEWFEHTERDPENAIDRLACLPRPDEIELGVEYDAARDRVDRLRRRLEIVDEVLNTALAATGRCPPLGYRNARRCAPGEIVYHVQINGRSYLLLAASLGGNLQRVWPSPSDTFVDFDELPRPASRHRSRTSSSSRATAAS